MTVISEGRRDAIVYRVRVWRRLLMLVTPLLALVVMDGVFDVGRSPLLAGLAILGVWLAAMVLAVVFTRATFPRWIESAIATGVAKVQTGASTDSSLRRA